MATLTAHTTPTTNQAPVVVEVEKELSGAQWCPRYPRSDSIVTLQPSFQLAVSGFIFALEQAGATCRITNTYRPPEACYLTHYAWMIWKGQIKAEAVPAFPGVLIEWVHGTRDLSVRAATAMCARYDLMGLVTAPALQSNHTKGLAIDVVIGWVGALKVKDANDQEVVISSTPRDNMNAELWKLGESFGVKRFFKPWLDKPHWSFNGR